MGWEHPQFKKLSELVQAVHDIVDEGHKIGLANLNNFTTMVDKHRESEEQDKKVQDVVEKE